MLYYILTQFRCKEAQIHTILLTLYPVGEVCIILDDCYDHEYLNDVSVECKYWQNNLSGYTDAHIYG